MTARRRIGEVERAEIFSRAKGRCHICMERIDGGREAWEVEHVVPRELGGDEAKGSTNLQPTHARCHAPKTAEDAGRIAKAKRLARRTLGIGKQPKHPLPGSRNSNWKIPINGPARRR